MCCGRGVWHQEFHSEDELDAHINAIADESRRLLVRTRWLQDRLAQMNEDLESAREDLARAQADLADLARAQADLARAQRDSQPRHATWLSSLLQERRPADASEAGESVVTPCAWHDDADHGYHNVADLSCVVGNYNHAGLD